jgi:hypothetical protein
MINEVPDLGFQEDAAEEMVGFDDFDENLKQSDI